MAAIGRKDSRQPLTASGMANSDKDAKQADIAQAPIDVTV
jgi:hypothetical protein